jgi:hypothetical protein
MAETITHIVLFKYKPDISWEAFEKHFEQFMGLKQKSLSKKTGKPLIKSLKAGKCTCRRHSLAERTIFTTDTFK